MRQRRKEHFFSKVFDRTHPGPLFPAGWAPSFGIASTPAADSAPEARQGGLQLRLEYTGESAEVLRQALETCIPIFERTTEEGLRFAIYQLGSLEVRTTKDSSGEETIGAVFSFGSPKVASSEEKDRRIHEEDIIIKATEYVERASAEKRKGSSVSYYVVFETAKGHKIVIECLQEGTLSWQEETGGNLEDRNSLAKVMRSAGQTASLKVKDLQAH